MESLAAARRAPAATLRGMNERTPDFRGPPAGGPTDVAARAAAALSLAAALAGAAPAWGQAQPPAQSLPQSQDQGPAQDQAQTTARTPWLAPADRIRLAYTPRVFHVTHDDDYVDWNHIVALEWLTPRHTFWGADRSHFGVSLFDNSYGQFSQSVYAGLEWDWTRALGGEVFLSLSAGLVHGYKEPYEDKLPLNNALGVGLTLVPAIGWQRGALGFAASLSGSALALRISYTFER
jgi:hypothetical protein